MSTTTTTKKKEKSREAFQGEWERAMFDLGNGLGAWSEIWRRVWSVVAVGVAFHCTFHFCCAFFIFDGSEIFYKILWRFLYLCLWFWCSLLREQKSPWMTKLCRTIPKNDGGKVFDKTHELQESFDWQIRVGNSIRNILGVKLFFLHELCRRIECVCCFAFAQHCVLSGMLKSGEYLWSFYSNWLPCTWPVKQQSCSSWTLWSCVWNGEFYWQPTTWHRYSRNNQCSLLLR